MKQYLPISIVIPTMNRPNTLSRTIECIMAKDNVPSQIVVVDQSESENNKAINRNVLMKYQDSVITNYIYQETPSLTKARNKGLGYCINEIIIYSDDDVDVNDETVKNVYEIMTDNDIAMIAGIDENMGLSKSKLGYLFYNKSYKNRHIGHVTMSMYGRFPDQLKGEAETQWAMGYFFVVRKSLLNQWCIGWDEALTSYAYAEDLDFSYSYFKRVKDENKRCILTEKVKVKHLASQEYRVSSYKSTLMYVINREYLSYKHFSTPFSRLATRWSNFGEFLNRVVRRSAPLDMIKAQIYCDKYRKDIKSGKLHNELYKNEE